MKNWSFNSMVLLAAILWMGCGPGKRVNGKEPDAPPARERGTTDGTPREAPRPGAPDQERLDSLKREKLKDKQP